MKRFSRSSRPRVDAASPRRCEMARCRFRRSRSSRNSALRSFRSVRWTASRMTFIVPDTSTWARRGQPDVGAVLSDAIERNDIAMAVPVLLELLWSARNARDLTEQALEYDALRQVELTPAIGRRAVAVQAALARRGQHRGPSPNDLLTAACAEAVGAEIWHCDRDFELIAEVTGQPQRRLGE